MASVSDHIKEASKLGGVQGNSTSRLGYALGCMEAAIPDDNSIYKIAQIMRIPIQTVKLAVMLKRASPLLSALGIGAALAGGIPIATGVSRGLSRGVERSLSGANSMFGGQSMSNIGGMSPEEMREFNKIIMQQALRNYQSQALLNSLRMANTRPTIGGESTFGA